VLVIESVLYDGGSTAQISGGRRSAHMHERDDENILATKLINHAPGVYGNFANIGIVQFCHAPADVGSGWERRCTPVDLPCHGLGVARRIALEM